jgi:hypothetical protein
MPPFVRGRFEDLPATPRRPHRWNEIAGKEVEVLSKHFGKVRTH